MGCYVDLGPGHVCLIYARYMQYAGRLISTSRWAGQWTLDCGLSLLFAECREQCAGRRGVLLTGRMNCGPWTLVSNYLSTLAWLYSVQVGNDGEKAGGTKK